MWAASHLIFEVGSLEILVEEASENSAPRRGRPACESDPSEALSLSGT
jgi:hypothetical protein